MTSAEERWLHTFSVGGVSYRALSESTNDLKGSHWITAVFLPELQDNGLSAIEVPSYRDVLIAAIGLKHSAPLATALLDFRIGRFGGSKVEAVMAELALTLNQLFPKNHRLQLLQEGLRIANTRSLLDSFDPRRIIDVTSSDLSDLERDYRAMKNPTALASCLSEILE
jgi:hypothetical protein